MPNPERPIGSLLVLGGARSGKSRYAQSLAENSRRSPVLIATADAHDAEMALRIARHAASRDARWALVEEPVAVATALRREARKDQIVVVDCATLWLSNLLLRNFSTSRERESRARKLSQISVLTYLNTWTKMSWKPVRSARTLSLRVNAKARQPGRMIP